MPPLPPFFFPRDTVNAPNSVFKSPNEVFVIKLILIFFQNFLSKEISQTPSLGSWSPVLFPFLERLTIFLHLGGDFVGIV